MNRKEKRRLKKIKNERRAKTKEKRMLTKYEKRKTSDLSFRISFSVTLMAFKDLYPEVDFDMTKIIHRVNDILSEFVTIGNKELDMLLEVCKDEFEVNIKGL